LARRLKPSPKFSKWAKCNLLKPSIEATILDQQNPKNAQNFRTISYASRDLCKNKKKIENRVGGCVCALQILAIEKGTRQEWRDSEREKKSNVGDGRKKHSKKECVRERERES
jgi:hypothetical protein